MTHDFISLKAHDKSGTFDGYLSMPPSGTGPGLVLIQEIFGVNHTMREVANSYAQKGYVVLVPDLFWRQQPNIELGYTPDEWQKAFGFYKAMNELKGIEDIQTSITTLRTHPAVKGKVGVLGFCMGGKLAYLTACRTDVDVAVGYYGVGIESALDEAKNITCRLVLHIAHLDQFCPPEAQQKIQQALGEKNSFEVYVYPDVAHAFARPGGDHFDKAAAELSQIRSIAAIKAEIGPF